MNDILKWVSDNKDVVQVLSSLVAVLVGLLSIILTTVTLGTNRRHNRLSVRPIADISAGDYEDKLFVRIVNKGNGPLIIKSFHAIKDGTSKSNLIDLMPQVPQSTAWSDFVENVEGTALRPSESLDLIEFNVNMISHWDREIRDSIRQSLSRITVELDYSDIYGNTFKYPQHSLAWFGRHFENTQQLKKTISTV